MNDQERADFWAALWALIGILGVSTVVALSLWHWGHL